MVPRRVTPAQPGSAPVPTFNLGQLSLLVCRALLGDPPCCGLGGVVGVLYSLQKWGRTFVLLHRFAFPLTVRLRVCFLSQLSTPRRVPAGGGDPKG